MITFEYVTFRNILSFGNKPTTYNFSTGITKITGSNGAGKCVEGDTFISVNFKDSTIENKFVNFITDNDGYSLIDNEIKFIGKIQTDNKPNVYNVTILNVVNFFKQYPEYFNNVFVKTRLGFKAIKFASITALDSEVYKLTTDKGNTLKGSPDHLILTLNRGWITLSKVQQNDFFQTESGVEFCENLEKMDYLKDLYDLQVDEVEEYYTNGFVSHNSSLIDIVHYALFGNPYRKINKPQLINSYNNGGLQVEIGFTSKNKKYVVRRGMKPNIFEIEIDGVKEDEKSRSLDFQSWFEKEILGFDSFIFDQIAVKSLTKDISIFNMTKQERRKIIENIFGVSIFSTMKELNKIEFDKLEQQKYDCLKQKQNIQLLTEQELENIKKIKLIKEQFEKQKKQEFTKYKQELDALTLKSDKINEQLKIVEKTKQRIVNLNKDLNDQKKLKKDLLNKQKNHEHYIAVHNDKINFFQQNCPSCPNINNLNENIDIDNHRKDLDKIKNRIEKLESIIETTSSKINDYETKLHEFDKLNITLNHITQRQNELTNLLHSSNHKLIEIDESKYLSYKQQLIDIDQNIDHLEDELIYLKTTNNLLQDDGIKSFFIQRYLPHLNMLMNKYLYKFATDLEMNFDVELNLNIKTKFRENFSYFSFSEGQKKKINLSLLFTFLDFCKLKHHTANFNFLFLDEIENGLDTQSQNILYDILNEIKTNEQKEIIVISHSVAINPEYFDNVYQITNNNGYSSIELIQN